MIITNVPIYKTQDKREVNDLLIEMFENWCYCALILFTKRRTEEKCYKPNTPGLCRQGRWFVAVSHLYHDHHHFAIYYGF